MSSAPDSELGLQPAISPVAAGGASAARGARSSVFLGGWAINTPPRKPTLAISVLAVTWPFYLVQGAAVFLASLLSGALYAGVFHAGSFADDPFIAVGLVAGVLFAAIMHIVDGIWPHRPLNSRAAFRDFTLVWLLVVLLITFLAFSLKAGAQLSRLTLLSFICLGFIAVSTSRTLMLQAMAWTMQHDRATGQRIVVIGARGASAVGTLVDQLFNSGHVDPIQILVEADCHDDTWQEQFPTFLHNLYSTLRTSGHGDLIVAEEGLSAARLQQITDALVPIPRAVRVYPKREIEQLLRLPVQTIGSLYSFEIQKGAMSAVQRRSKRALDLAISFPLLLLILPGLLVIAALVKLDSPGPVLFKQRRHGYRGRLFTILKFRTMCVLEDGSEVQQACKNDARVTRVGRILRKTSLDELPQLWNVIIGDMSLVGPRPHAIAHDEFYQDRVAHYDVRQHVKPGISGWAQVNGARGETSSVDLMRKRIELDIWYAKHANLWLDIKILLLTAFEVVRGRNAY